MKTLPKTALGSIALLICGFLLSSAILPEKEFKCLPCGLPCDEETYSGLGECKSCHMRLVEASAITFKSIPPDAICPYIASHPSTLLLDVRTREEFAGQASPDFGSLKNAVNIPIQELEARLPELAAYKNREILVFCSHSHRSPQASYTLTQNGFRNVVNLSGGMSEVADRSCKK